MQVALRRSLSAVALAAIVAACGEDEAGSPGPLNLPVDTEVTVAADGGAATVMFRGTSGQTVRISLTATPLSLPATLPHQPYGSLATPGGGESYTPPSESASNRQNTADVALTETGTYTLTVFDGTNQGAKVRVRIERID
jgi:hypothetical protein